MSNDDAQLALAAEFAPATREAWLKLVHDVLKGADFDKTLVATTHDGLRIEPLHARDARARPLAARPAGTPWQVMQRIDHPDPAAANAEARHEIDNGASGLMLVFAGAVGAYGYGLEASAATLARVLDGIFPERGVSVELVLGPQCSDAGEMLAGVLARRGLAPGALDLRFGFDPLGAMAQAGAGAQRWPELAPAFAGAVARLARAGFRGPFAAADGRVVHAAGGSEAQELAHVLAVALAYLRALEAGGVALDHARRMIFFRLAADADQFLTIAKFRSLRKLWARVEDACGLAPQPAFVAAETAWRMMTRRDPWANMLRATIAAAAAGLGGANAVTVLPFTAALGLPDRFARRIARNTQLILIEESNLARVSDPAAGSGSIESITNNLSRAAWSLFQEIEAAGGAAAALEGGLIQQRVARVRAEREQAVAHRREALTGTSEFPDLGEAPVSVLDVPPVAAPAAAPAAVTFLPLPPMRLAEPFEALRDASDRVLAATGSRPAVFLANLGRPSDFTARANFAKNLFEAGGIAAIMFEPQAPSAGAARGARGAEATDLSRLAAAFAASGARLACLCASDAVYAGEGAAAAKTLRAAGASHLYVAGTAGAAAPPLREAGVSTFIHSGCDVLAVLRAAHRALGLAP